jgi:hypothetical protein
VAQYLQTREAFLCLNVPVQIYACAVQSTCCESQDLVGAFTVIPVANHGGVVNCSRFDPTEEASNKAAVPTGICP